MMYMSFGGFEISAMSADLSVYISLSNLRVCKLFIVHIQLNCNYNYQAPTISGKNCND